MIFIVYFTLNLQCVEAFIAIVGSGAFDEWLWKTWAG